MLTVALDSFLKIFMNVFSCIRSLLGYVGSFVAEHGLSSSGPGVQ